MRGRALSVLARYNKFDPDSEHDCGVFIFAGYSFEWRIEYRGKDGIGMLRLIRRTRIRRFACSRSTPSTTYWRRLVARPAGRALVAALPEPRQIPNTGSRVSAIR